LSEAFPSQVQIGDTQPSLPNNLSIRFGWPQGHELAESRPLDRAIGACAASGPTRPHGTGVVVPRRSRRRAP
jgi:hypothetical protein